MVVPSSFISPSSLNALNQTLQNIDNSLCELTEYNDMLVRKLIEYIKVNNKIEILIIFKGGIEVIVPIEK